MLDIVKQIKEENHHRKTLMNSNWISCLLLRMSSRSHSGIPDKNEVVTAQRNFSDGIKKIQYKTLGSRTRDSSYRGGGGTSKPKGRQQIWLCRRGRHSHGLHASQSPTELCLRDTAAKPARGPCVFHPHVCKETTQLKYLQTENRKKNKVYISPQEKKESILKKQQTLRKIHCPLPRLRVNTHLWHYVTWSVMLFQHIHI